MTDVAPQFTLRQLRQQMTQPAAMAIFVGIAAILTIMAPFGTGELRPVPRGCYWLGTVVVTYGVGSFVAGSVLTWLGGKVAWPLQVAITSVAVGLVIAPLILVINWALFGDWPDAMVGFLLTVASIAALITAIGEVIDHGLSDRTSDSSAATAPAILDRIPIEKRGRLLALSVEDHYVRVRTDAGEALILMRLSDAIGETGPAKGLQVHRSHWVAIDAVVGAKRNGDRAILTLQDGTEIPASRSNLPKLREAGLLPR